MTPHVVAVHSSPVHEFSKNSHERIQLIAGMGVDGDTHAGETVQHRSRVARDPSQPNLRQVHLIHRELFDEVAAEGFDVQPGDLGENITTEGIDLLGLPRGTRLIFGDGAEVEITGLRNPCSQIDDFQDGLMAQMVNKRADGSIERKAGVMSVVIAGGEVTVGDAIRVVLPDGEHVGLEPV